MSVVDVVREGARKTRQPAWMQPMLATLSSQREFGRGWVFERKLDGIRALAFKSGRDVTLLSRNKLDVTREYADVVRALRAQDHDFVLDGELIATLGRRSSFELLQQRGTLKGVKLSYAVFDVLWADGYDLTALPLLARKEVLARILHRDRAVGISTHRARWSLDEACAKGWEGLIAKRADAPYAKGRSRDWLKLKCTNEQEFVVGGFTDPKGAREGFGALIIGVYDGGELRYAGEVGTGFSGERLRELRARLGRIERHDSPFADHPRAGKGEHFVEPEIVVQVRFTEWTRDGKLRHPAFVGERKDKRARDVVRERTTA